MVKKKREGAEEKEYFCGFCECVFKQVVYKYVSKGKHGSVSSQVKCPRCGNFLPTWED